MICEACRERRHGECRGGTWCDCQHKPPAGDRRADQTAVPGPASTGPGEDRSDPYDDDREDGSEPGVNWLRQG